MESWTYINKPVSLGCLGSLRVTLYPGMIKSESEIVWDNLDSDTPNIWKLSPELDNMEAVSANLLIAWLMLRWPNRSPSFDDQESLETFITCCDTNAQPLPTICLCIYLQVIDPCMLYLHVHVCMVYDVWFWKSLLWMRDWKYCNWRMHVIWLNAPQWCAWQSEKTNNYKTLNDHRAFRIQRSFKKTPTG